MRYAIEVGSAGFIKIDSGLEEIRLLPQQLERLHCWYCRREGL
jgi:hypothetical protein